MCVSVGYIKTKNIFVGVSNSDGSLPLICFSDFLLCFVLVWSSVLLFPLCIVVICLYLSVLLCFEFEITGLLLF
jgi:hypothetical protein